MEELAELRSYIEQGRYPEALVLLGEMDEMSYSDKVNKIGSFLEILLLHLIKQHAEQRSTRSWDVSIHNAVREILRTNKRRKSGGYYLNQEDLREAMKEVYENALGIASLEAFEGRYDPAELAKLVNEYQVTTEALKLILDAS
jgi:hypothetical protein